MRAGAPVGPVALINRPLHPAGSGCDLRRHEARLNCAREATLGNRGTAKTRTQGQNQRDIAVAGCRGVAQGGRACTGGAREGAAGRCGPGGRCGCHARRRGRRLCGQGAASPACAPCVPPPVRRVRAWAPGVPGQPGGGAAESVQQVCYFGISRTQAGAQQPPAQFWDHSVACAHPQKRAHRRHTHARVRAGVSNAPRFPPVHARAHHTRPLPAQQRCFSPCVESNHGVCLVAA